jgi:hypothetical protein
LYQWTCTGGSVLSMQDEEPQIHRLGKLPLAGRLALKSIGGGRVAADAASDKLVRATPVSGMAATAAL